MKIIIVGASGTIGQAIVKELEPRHDIVKVGKQSGDVQVDITSLESIDEMYRQIGAFDALISAAGELHFGALPEFTPEQYQVGIQSKLMGQVNLVHRGLQHINDGGSFTLTTGILSQEPIPYGASASMVNSAVEGWVVSAATELPRGIRLNVVSPTLVEESVPHYGPYFRGFDPIPASKAALGYAKSVEGLRTGQVFQIKGLS